MWMQLFYANCVKARTIPSLDLQLPFVKTRLEDCHFTVKTKIWTRYFVYYLMAFLGILIWNTWIVLVEFDGKIQLMEMLWRLT